MSDDILIQRLLRYQHPTMDDAARRITELKEENGRLREAMEKIAYLESSQVRGKPRRTTVEEIARAALGEEKK